MSSIQALPAVLASCQAGQSSRTRALQERFNTRVLLMVAQIPSSVAVPPPHPTSVAREALVPSTSHPLATLPPAHLGTRSSGENLASALATFIRHSPARCWERRLAQVCAERRDPAGPTSSAASLSPTVPSIRHSTARCLEQRLAQVCAERRDPAGPTSSAASLSLTLPSSPVPRVATVRRATPPASSPSQHVGLFRAAMLVAGALSSVWKEGQVLVDSGSQQAPLLSHDFAAAVVGGRGPLAALAAQADGSLLKLYSLPPVDLCVNGKPQRVRWPAADIAPYDCILGESWLYANAGVLDYKANQLWTSTASGLVPLDLGRRPAAPLLDVPGFAGAQQQCAEADSVRRVTALVEAASAPPSPSPGCSARQRRLARRHCGLAVVTNTARAFPEDVELNLGELPGLAPAEETSFSFVAASVRSSLRHLPDAMIEQIVQRLRGYETDVFETRTMPKAPPHRRVDLDVTLRDDEPVYRRPYPVTAHHMQGLDW